MSPFYRAKEDAYTVVGPWQVGPTRMYTNGATVVGDILSDTFPRPVDSLTEGGLYLSHRRGARWSNVACGVVCRGYRVGALMGEAEPSYPTGIVG